MLLAAAAILGGFIILIWSADLFVDGAASIAENMGMPPIIIGMTIVSLGTSAPEVLVSINASLSGSGSLAIGNAIGSNIANILLVLGIPAILAPIHTSHCNSRRNFVMMIAASVLFIALAADGFFRFGNGVVLLGALALVLGSAFYQARCHKKAEAAMEMDEEEVEGADPDMPWWRIIVFLLLGLIGLTPT